MIIVATATGDMLFPSVANILQERLGTGKVATMDQLAACSGFMYSMITAKQYIQSGDYKHILVVGADKLSKITDMTDRSTAVLFGDGAELLSWEKLLKVVVSLAMKWVQTVVVVNTCT